MEPASGVDRAQPRKNKRRASLNPGSGDDLETRRRRIKEEYEAGVAAIAELEERVREMRKRGPATSSSVALLPTPRAGDTRELYCHICHDDFEEGDKLRTMPCAHSFHQRCIFDVLRFGCRCLVCGYKLPGEREERMLDDDARAASGNMS